MVKQKAFVFRVLCSFIALAVVWSSGVTDLLKLKYASAADLTLSAPGTMVSLSQAGDLPLIQGIKFDPANPFDLQFILERNGQASISEEEKGKLIRYFFAGLTIADENLWVNLSPYENERIIDNKVNETEIAETFLAQDYLLKQLSSSITHPATQLGEKYWESVGASRATPDTNTFNKIWISPSSLSIYDAKDTILITDIELDVQTEADYLAAKNNSVNSVSNSAVQEHVVPAIKKDVNSGANFAPLRQMINSLALAQLFKKKFSDSLYSFYYDAGLIKGIDKGNPSTKDTIFNQYVEAFNQGAYNTVKKVRNQNGNLIKRNYFSGGMSSSLDATVFSNVTRAELLADNRRKELVAINTKFEEKYPKNQAAVDYSYKQVATASSNVEQFEARVDALTSDIDSLAEQTTNKELAEQLKVLSSSIEEITSELSTEVDAAYLNKTMDLAKNFAKDPTLSSSLVSELEKIYKQATGGNVVIKTMSLFMLAALGYVSVDRLAESVYAPMPDVNDIFYASVMTGVFFMYNFFASLGTAGLKQGVSSQSNYLYDDLLDNKVKSMNHLYQTLFLSTNFYNYDFDKTISALKQIDNFDGERIEKNSQVKLEIENIIFDLENNKVNQEYWKKSLSKDTYKKLKKLKSSMLSYQEAISSDLNKNPFVRNSRKFINRSIALASIAIATMVTAYLVNDRELTAEQINQKIEFFNESLETKNTELERQKIIFDRKQKERNNLLDSIDTYQKMLKDEHGIDADTKKEIEEKIDTLSSSIEDLEKALLAVIAITGSAVLFSIFGMPMIGDYFNLPSPNNITEQQNVDELKDSLLKELNDSLGLDDKTSVIFEETIEKLSSSIYENNPDIDENGMVDMTPFYNVFNKFLIFTSLIFLAGAATVAPFIGPNDEQTQKPETNNEIKLDAEQLESIKSMMNNMFKIDSLLNDGTQTNLNPETSALIEEAIEKLSSSVLIHDERGSAETNGIIIMVLMGLLVLVALRLGVHGYLNQPEQKIKHYNFAIENTIDSLESYQKIIEQYTQKYNEAKTYLDGLTDSVAIYQNILNENQTIDFDTNSVDSSKTTSILESNAGPVESLDSNVIVEKTNDMSDTDSNNAEETDDSITPKQVNPMENLIKLRKMQKMMDGQLPLDPLDPMGTVNPFSQVEIHDNAVYAHNGGIDLEGLTDGVEIAQSSAVITLSAKEIENIAGLTFEFVGPSKVLPLSQILTPVMPK